MTKIYGTNLSDEPEHQRKCDGHRQPENSGKKQDTKFRPGKSGNPAGKPKGARNKATEAVMLLLEGESEKLTRKAIEKALDGDGTALRLCLERLAPAPKSAAQPIYIELPESDNLASMARGFLTAAANGEIPPDIAALLVTAAAGVAKVEEMENVKERLEALERAIKDREKAK